MSTELQLDRGADETDEQIFLQTRAVLDGRASLDGALQCSPISAVSAPGAPAPAAGKTRVWQRGQAWLLIAAALSLLGWTFPHTLGGARGWGVLIFLCVAVGHVLKEGKALNEAAKSNRPFDERPLLGAQAPFFRSVAVALSIAVIIFPPTEAVWYIATVLIHESGHFLAMRLFGYRDLRMALTYFGGITIGEKDNVPPWQDAVILLSGPLPGLALGCSLYFLKLPASSTFLQIGAAWLVTLNFINLMPVASLDGEKLLNVLLFQRSTALVRKVLLPAAFGLTYLICNPGWLSLSLTALCILCFVPTSYKIARAADILRLRWRELPPRMNDMTDAQWRDLFEVTRGRFSRSRLDNWMKTIYGYAIIRRAPAKVAMATAAIYLGALALAATCASTTQLRSAAGRWPVLPIKQIEGLKARGS